MIAKNEQKIADIQENKIPTDSRKLRVVKARLAKLTAAKRDIVQHKLDRVIALNDTIKSFHYRPEMRSTGAAFSAYQQAKCGDFWMHDDG